MSEPSPVVSTESEFQSAILGVETAAKPEEAKAVSFFEAHPKAIAIGAAAAGALAMLILVHLF
jgi:hypothetical protein